MFDGTHTTFAAHLAVIICYTSLGFFYKTPLDLCYNTHRMNKKPETQVNNGAADSGLSQERFAGLLKELDDKALSELLERVGLSFDDLAEEVPEDRKAETEAETDADPAEEGLTPEMIGHLLRSMSDDALNGLLESAGLSRDDLPAVSDVAAEEIPTDDSSEKDEAGGTEDPSTDDGSDAVSEKSNETGKKKKWILKSLRSKRFLLIAVIAGALLLPLALNKIYLSAILNSNDPIQYSEPVDDIFCAEGTLGVNRVKVTVPTDGTEKYDISYSWAEDDGQYPSVPHAITALYSDQEGKSLYSISLYRNETVATKDIPSGKTSDNWFDEWTPVTEGDVLQAPLDTKNVKGFYICPNVAEDGTVADYDNYSYYFAVYEDDGGISIYVLEGVCMDEGSRADFAAIMDGCIQNISIKEPAGE